MHFIAQDLSIQYQSSHEYSSHEQNIAEVCQLADRAGVIQAEQIQTEIISKGKRRGVYNKKIIAQTNDGSILKQNKDILQNKPGWNKLYTKKSYVEMLESKIKTLMTNQDNLLKQIKLQTNLIDSLKIQTPILQRVQSQILDPNLHRLKDNLKDQFQIKLREIAVQQQETIYNHRYTLSEDDPLKYNQQQDSIGVNQENVDFENWIRFLVKHQCDIVDRLFYQHNQNILEDKYPYIINDGQIVYSQAQSNIIL